MKNPYAGVLQDSKRRLLAAVSGSGSIPDVEKYAGKCDELKALIAEHMTAQAQILVDLVDENNNDGPAMAIKFEQGKRARHQRITELCTELGIPLSLLDDNTDEKHASNGAIVVKLSGPSGPPVTVVPTPVAPATVVLPPVVAPPVASEKETAQTWMPLFPTLDKINESDLPPFSKYVANKNNNRHRRPMYTSDEFKTFFKAWEVEIGSACVDAERLYQSLYVKCHNRMPSYLIAQIKHVNFKSPNQTIGIFVNVYARFAARALGYEVARPTNMTYQLLEIVPAPKLTKTKTPPAKTKTPPAKTPTSVAVQTAAALPPLHSVSIKDPKTNSMRPSDWQEFLALWHQRYNSTPVKAARLLDNIYPLVKAPRIENKARRTTSYYFGIHLRNLSKVDLGPYKIEPVLRMKNFFYKIVPVAKSAEQSHEPPAAVQLQLPSAPPAVAPPAVAPTKMTATPSTSTRTTLTVAEAVDMLEDLVDIASIEGREVYYSTSELMAMAPRNGRDGKYSEDDVRVFQRCLEDVINDQRPDFGFGFITQKPDKERDCFVYLFTPTTRNRPYCQPDTPMSEDLREYYYPGFRQKTFIASIGIREMERWVYIAAVNHFSGRLSEICRMIDPLCGDSSEFGKKFGDRKKYKFDSLCSALRPWLLSFVTHGFPIRIRNFNGNKPMIVTVMSNLSSLTPRERDIVGDITFDFEIVPVEEVAPVI